MSDVSFFPTTNQCSKFLEDNGVYGIKINGKFVKAISGDKHLFKVKNKMGEELLPAVSGPSIEKSWYNASVNRSSDEDAVSYIYDEDPELTELTVDAVDIELSR